MATQRGEAQGKAGRMTYPWGTSRAAFAQAGPRGSIEPKEGHCVNSTATDIQVFNIGQWPRRGLSSLAAVEFDPRTWFQLSTDLCSAQVQPRCRTFSLREMLQHAASTTSLAA